MEVELGFFEDIVDDENSSSAADDVLLMHQDGNFMRWDDGVAGGDEPIWLAPLDEAMDVQKEFKCQKCEERMTFLLQVYAPLDGDGFEQAFHRVLYVFICRNPACKANVKVFRSQLGKNNGIYQSECLDEDEEVGLKVDRETWPSIKSELDSKPFPLKRIVTEPEPKSIPKKCEICGVPATAHCVVCKSVYYCSKDHQKEHWPKHKMICKLLEAELNKPDEDVDDEEENEDEKITQEDLNKVVAGEDENLQARLKRSKDDEFDRFQLRISREPEQCIRYCRWPMTTGSNEDDEDENDNKQGPLWISSENKCQDVPNCENCGAPRGFEFQILPQTLHYLNEIDLDFGTICVYTCTKSCVPSPALSSSSESSCDGSLSPEYGFVQNLSV